MSALTPRADIRFGSGVGISGARIFLPVIPAAAKRSAGTQNDRVPDECSALSGMTTQDNFPSDAKTGHSDRRMRPLAPYRRGAFGPSDDTLAGSGVLSLNLHKCRIEQSQHFGLRATQV